MDSKKNRKRVPRRTQSEAQSSASESASSESGGASSARNMRISSGSLRRPKSKANRPDMLSDSYSKKLRTNNVQLAKSLARYKESVAHYKAMEVSRNQLMVQLHEEVAFREETMSRVESYVSQSMRQIQGCVDGLLQIQQEVINCRSRPNTNAVKQQWENRQTLPFKAATGSKTQTVNPMVSGCTITQPRVSLSRVDNVDLAVPNGGLLLPPDPRFVAGIIEETDSESESSTLESEASSSDSEASESSDSGSSSCQVVEPHVFEPPAPGGVAEEARLDEIAEADSDDDQEPSLVIHTKRRFPTAPTKTHAKRARPLESQSAFRSRVYGENAMEGTSRPAGGKYRKAPVRLKQVPVPSPPLSLASDVDADTCNRTSYSSVDMDETVSNLSPILLDVAQATTEPLSPPGEPTPMFDMPVNIPGRISPEFAEAMGMPSKMFKRDSSNQIETQSISTGTSCGAEMATGNSRSGSMPNKVLNVNIVPLSESAIAKASSKTGLSEKPSTHTPNALTKYAVANHGSKSKSPEPFTGSMQPSVVIPKMSSTVIGSGSCSVTVRVPSADCAQTFVNDCTVSTDSSIDAGTAKTSTACTIKTPDIDSNPTPTLNVSKPSGRSVSGVHRSETQVKTPAKPSHLPRFKSPLLGRIRLPFVSPTSTSPLALEGESKSAMTFKAKSEEPSVAISKSADHHKKKRVLASHASGSSLPPARLAGIENENTPKSHVADQRNHAKSSTNDMLPRVMVKKLERNDLVTPRSIVLEEEPTRTRSALRKIAPTNYKEQNIKKKLRREDGNDV